MADATCCCGTLPDLAVVPMGSDGQDERVFATLDRIADHGGERWWLHASRCNACGQHWMVAQEERIYDEYFLRRIDGATMAGIADGRWPLEFATYEAVLRIARTMSQPCVFFDRMSPDLVDTAADLRRARPDITAEEIGHLLGIMTKGARKLLKAI